MRVSLSLAAILAMCFSISASAHHSHGNYEETFRDITGVVKEVHLVLPHSWVYIEVKGASGAPELWALEATGRTQLQREGVGRDYLKVGDTIKARCHQLRDGTNGCLLGFLKAPDGTVRNWDNGRVVTDLTDF